MLIGESSIVKKNHWTYSYEVDTKLYFGFIYLITNNLTGVKYIGKKGFRTKGKSWKNYTSCCKPLNTDIKNFGKDNFLFEILELCDSKESLARRETFLQIRNNVLTEKLPSGNRAFYNRNIRGEKFDMSGVIMSETTKIKLGLYGNSNHMFDNSIYEFWNKTTDEIFSGTQKDFQNKTDIISADCVSLIKGRQVSCKNWCLLSSKDIPHKNSDITIYRFKHTDGREIVSTRIEFQRLNNFHNIEVGQLIYGKRKTTKGWMLDVT